MKTVQVIGGSGFIGTNLMQQLQGNYSINNIDKTASENFLSVTTIVDIRDKQKLSTALQPSDWIVLLAAEHRDDISPVSLYYDVNVDGTKNVLSVMNEKNICKIIFTSTVAVYGLNKANPDEESKEDPFNDYGKSKWQAEEILRSWYNEDPENRTLIILRPTVVFGPANRGNVYNLLKQISSGRFLMIGNGNNKKSMAYVENTVGFIKYCIDNNFAGYHLFNYADKPDLTTNELLQTVEQFMNKKLPTVHIPYTIGYASGIIFDVVSKFTGKKFAISSVRIKKFCATTEFMANKVLQTGFKPAFPLKEAIGITINSIQKEQS